MDKTVDMEVTLITSLPFCVQTGSDTNATPALMCVRMSTGSGVLAGVPQLHRRSGTLGIARGGNGHVAVLRPISSALHDLVRKVGESTVVGKKE